MKGTLVPALICTLALFAAAASIYLSYCSAAACATPKSIGQQSPPAEAPNSRLQQKADEIIAEIRAMRAEVAKQQSEKERSR